MNWRSKFFYVHALSLYLIISIPTTYPADGGATVSIVKTVGNWAVKNIGNIVKGALAGAAAYNAKNFDPGTSTFETAGFTSEAQSGVPVGTQSSGYIDTPEERTAEREFKSMTPEKQAEYIAQRTAEKAQNYTLRELNEWITRDEALIASAKEEVAYRTRKKQMDQVNDNQTRIKQYEATKEALVKEKESRKPRNYKGIVKRLSDRSLKRLLRNTQEELAAEKQTLTTENSKYWWSKDESLVHNTENKIGHLEHKLQEINTEQANRTKSRVITTTATAMVLTSETTGTSKTTTTKMETAPEGGRGGSNQDPEKDPKKGPGLKDAAGVYGVKKAKEHLTEPHPESHSSTSTPHTDTHVSSGTTKTEISTKKYEKSREAHNEHEQKTFEQTQANVAQMRKDKPFKNEPKAPNPDLHQPPHITKKDLEYDDRPGKHEHIFAVRPAHVEQDTTNARSIFNECVHNPENYLGQNKAGNFVYSSTNPSDGRQIYVYVREGKVVDAGSSSKPWTSEMLLGIDKKGP